MVSKKEWSIGIFLILLFLISRYCYIESDLPPWNLVYYQALDEPYYSLYGYNLYLFGTPTPKFADFIIQNYSGIGNFFIQILPYISLEIFGNNYIALRTPSIFLSLFVFLSIYIIGLKELKKAKKEDRRIATILLAFLLFYMFVDFSFNTAGRVLEPTIYRMAAMVAVILYAINVLENEITKRSSFMLGFLGFSSFIFVYLTNFFIVPALFFALFFSVFKAKGWNRAVHHSFVFIAGALLAFLIFNLLYYYIFRIDFFTSLMDAINTYSNRLAVSESNNQGMLKNLLTNVFNFFSTNLFRLNVGLLLFFLLTLPIFSKLLIKHKEPLAIVVSSLFIFLFLQSCILNDFPYRKLIILAPLVLFIIIYLISKKRESIEIFLVLKKNIYYRIYASTSLLFIFLVLYRTVYKALPFDDHLNLVILVINLIILAISLLFLFLKKYKLLTILWGVAILLPHFYLDIRYIYTNPTFKLKEAEEDISKITGKEYVLGGAAWSLKPYNDYTPLINAYAYLYHATPEIYLKHSLRLKKMFNVEYAIDYLTEKNIEKMNRLGFKVYKSYDINEAIGREIGLFRYKK